MGGRKYPQGENYTGVAFNNGTWRNMQVRR